MRKERMITRTITQTTVQFIGIDVATAEVVIVDTKIGGIYTSTELLKMFKKLYDTDTFKVVNIVSQATNEILLGMTESDFIKYATVLPLRTKKVGE